MSETPLEIIIRAERDGLHPILCGGEFQAVTHEERNELLQDRECEFWYLTTRDSLVALIDREAWVCETCEGEGTVEGPVSCNVVPSECCGGCTTMEACPDCDGDGIDHEPDYDAMRDDLRERDDLAAEVEWESPE